MGTVKLYPRLLHLVYPAFFSTLFTRTKLALLPVHVFFLTFFKSWMFFTALSVQMSRRFYLISIRKRLLIGLIAPFFCRSLLLLALVLFWTLISPSLCALPRGLASLIRRSPAIEGFLLPGASGRQAHVRLYADDTTVLLQNLSSQASLLDCINIYEKGPGAKLKKSKSEAMWLGT